MTNHNFYICFAEELKMERYASIKKRTLKSFNVGSDYHNYYIYIKEILSSNQRKTTSEDTKIKFEQRIKKEVN